MKKLVIVAAAIFVVAAAQSFINCADPLKGTASKPVGPIVDVDTVFSTDTLVIRDSLPAIDTIFVIDTVINNDTVAVIDTVFSIDTVYSIDTVIVVVPDSTQTHTNCGEITSRQKQIFWQFSNLEGTYVLRFVAEIERDHPPQCLIVDIGGEKHKWCPPENPEFVIEHHLDRNVAIRITTMHPTACGHKIEICLRLSRK